MFGKSKLIEEIEALRRENEQLKDKLRKYEPMPRKKSDVVEPNYNEVKAKIMAGKKYQEFINDFDNIKDNILFVEIYGARMIIQYASLPLPEVVKRISLQNNGWKHNDVSWNRLCRFATQNFDVYSIHTNKKQYFFPNQNEREWSELECEVIKNIVFEKFNDFDGYHNYEDDDYASFNCNYYVPNVPQVSVNYKDPY